MSRQPPRARTVGGDLDKDNPLDTKMIVSRSALTALHPVLDHASRRRRERDLFAPLHRCSTVSLLRISGLAYIISLVEKIRQLLLQHYLLGTVVAKGKERVFENGLQEVHRKCANPLTRNARPPAFAL